MTTWIAAGAIVVAGVFSAVAAKALPGKSKPATQSSTATGQNQSQDPTAPAVTGGGGSQDNGGLLPPDQVPQPTRGSGSVSSGSS